MNRPAGEQSEHPHGLAKLVVQKMRWPVVLIWLVPIAAAVMGGFYFYSRLGDEGPSITVRFGDATGLKAGESKVVHLGVQIGLVTEIELSDDQKATLVQIRLRRSANSFASRGSRFWIVRPELSMQEISGLATVLSGPIIDSIPGNGETQSEFTGLERAPMPVHDGLAILLKTPNLGQLRAESPIYFRGIQVGVVQEIQLSDDSTTADIRAVIDRRYMSLVRTNSEFWEASALDLKGGLFSGVSMKLESFRSLLSGGITFATPEEKMGVQAENGATFALYDEPKKEWLTWSPKISIEPDSSGQGEQNVAPPKAGAMLRSATGGK
jgi:paraquat-inducible protein B